MDHLYSCQTFTVIMLSVCVSGLKHHALPGWQSQLVMLTKTNFGTPGCATIHRLHGFESCIGMDSKVAWDKLAPKAPYACGLCIADLQI
jgi:hypothetical protein